jgi:pSer/pThr/pTyr-binding forkhead associated (FHA) protein
MEVKLVVETGPARGRVIPLPTTVFTIGRGSKCHLRPLSLEVSKLHCAIACWAGKVSVRDLKSVNGTFVNGERVEGEARIKDGDVLQVGPLTLSFHIRNDPDAPPVQIVRRGEVKWLLENTPVPELLDTSKTHELAIKHLLPLDQTGLPAGAADTDDGTALSAGQYFHDYLRRGKT